MFLRVESALTFGPHAEKIPLPSLCFSVIFHLCTCNAVIRVFERQNITAFSQASQTSDCLPDDPPAVYVNIPSVVNRKFEPFTHKKSRVYMRGQTVSITSLLAAH